MSRLGRWYRHWKDNHPMRTWTRRYRTRARGIDPPDVQETRRQELKRWRKRLADEDCPCPDKSAAPGRGMENGHRDLGEPRKGYV